MFDTINSTSLSNILKENFSKNRECLSWVLFYYAATVCKESNTPGNRFDKPFLYEKILRRGIGDFGWFLPNKSRRVYDANKVYQFVEKDKLPHDYVFFDSVKVSQKNWPVVEGASVIISNEQSLKVSDLRADAYFDVLWIPAYKECTNYVYSFEESKGCMLDSNGKIICKLRGTLGERIYSDSIYRARYNTPMNDHYTTIQEKFFQEILDNISIEKL